MLPPKGILCRSVFIFCLLLSYCALKAQQSIHFEDISFLEAVDKAKSQKKIVFVDVRGMNPNSYNEKADKEIFTLDSVANFFNAHCISIRVNMNSEEGKKFAPRLAMLMYPVYVFHGSNGDQLDFTNAGSITKDPGVLLAKARSSLAINQQKNSNTRSISFDKASWNDLLKKAKTQKKLIFLDAQTTWCRPCIMMAKDIFTLDSVADYYNSQFINVSMDMEKTDGPGIVKKYGIRGYPSFLYIDGDGILVHSDGGYQEAGRFMENGRTAIAQQAAGKTDGSQKLKELGMGGAAPGAKVIPFADATFVPASAGIAAVGNLAPAKAAANPADSGIHFTEVTWANLLVRAKKNNQLIFVDANTTWCGPCKQMRREIFPQKAVAQLYNRNFINIDLDMEKGEGIDFRKQYGVKAYPTFLFINGDGEVVHKVVGSCDAAQFRQHALDALSPTRNLLYLATAYKKNQQDDDFVTTYLAALRDAYESGKADTVAVTYLGTQNSSAWQQRSNWLLIKEYVNDATSAPFLTLVKEQPAFGNLYGQDEVESKIYLTYMGWAQHYLHYPEKGKAVLDQEPFAEFLKQVKISPYSKKEEIETRSQLTVYFALKDWNNYSATVNGMLSSRIVPMDAKGAEWLFSFADLINRFAGDDKKQLAEAVKWTKLISYSIEGISANDKATYLDLHATLLEKNGRTDLALQTRKEINQQQLTNAKQNAPFQTLIRIAPKQN
ncbi:thioredoxin fold domain-containing protein [Flavitalea flava]